MLRRIAAAVGAALISSSACAGFIQYDLKNVYFNDGASLSGYFIQDSDDRSIVHYALRVQSDLHLQYFEGTPSVGNVMSAETFFAGKGPTSFQVWSNNDNVYYNELSLSFTGWPQGPYLVAGWESENPSLSVEPGGVPAYRAIVAGGTASIGSIDPELLVALELGQRDGINHVVPTQRDPVVPLPEPASLALLAIGAMGAARMRAARKA